jgi:NAD(P)-dependent dehydrogenase (short-subunit alcohol dehydrogenase family)
MAREFGEHQVRVNCVMPGPVLTEVERGTMTPDQHARLLAAQCLRRESDPEDIARAVTFFASDQSSFVTGQALNVDGGLAHR